MRLAAAALSVTLATACTGQDDGRGLSAPEPLSPTTFRDAYAAAVCDGLAGCCSAEGHTYAREGCLAEVRAQVDAAWPPGGAFGFSAEAAATCVSKLRGRFSACLLGDADTNDACRAVHVGTRAPGQPCAVRAECTVPDGGTASCSAGACRTEIHGALGTPCHGTCERVVGAPFCTQVSDPPAAAAFCWVEDGVACGPAGTCVKAKAVGEPCNVNDCAIDGYCGGPTCKQKVGEGAPCTAPDACAGSWCDDVKGACAALLGAGAPCQGKGECAPPLGCVLAGQTGTCADPLALHPSAALCGSK